MSATWARFESILVSKIRYLKHQGQAFLGDVSGVTVNVDTRVEQVEKQKPQYPYKRAMRLVVCAENLYYNSLMRLGRIQTY
jgi:hypothetical protein